MDVNVDKNLWSFIDEERKNIMLPGRLSFGGNKNIMLPGRLSFGGNCHHHHEPPPDSDSRFASPRTSCASAASFPLWPASPETPWTRSPARPSPTQPLLYHCLASLHRNEGNIFSIAVSKDFIFTSSDSSRIHAWKQPDCTEMGFIKGKIGEIRAILAHGRFVFTTHRDYKIRVWDISSTENFRPKKITTLPKKKPFFFSHRGKKIHQHKDCISCLAYNFSEKLLYTGSWDKTVKAWKISQKQCIDSFLAHDSHVNAIVINQEDGCVFTCSSDGTVKIWRRICGEKSHILTVTLKFQASPVNALALSQSLKGCYLYSGSSDGLINFWEKEKMSGRFNHGGFLQGHHFAVLCLVSVGELVLSGSEDATIRIWRREEENCFHSCLAVMDGHHGPVKCLAAVLETEEVVIGLLVYSASLDQTLKVWRVKIYPAEKEISENLKFNDQKSEIMECEMNPVLSPSWVVKKIQSSQFG